MIDFIEGAILDKGLQSAEEAYWVIQTGGIGYKILTTPQNMQASPPARSSEAARIFTSLIVREDAMFLVGFLQRDERQCFELLIKASGVGVKSALALLAALSVTDLTVAIMTSDHKRLTVAKGIGPKVAQRIALELRDKMQAWRKTRLEQDDDMDAFLPTATPAQGVYEEVETVLMSLGYSGTEIYAALKQCQETFGATPSQNSAELLQHALRWLSLQTHQQTH
jgi:holliday junction DNA helicase RuvA